MKNFKKKRFDVNKVLILLSIVVFGISFYFFYRVYYKYNTKNDTNSFEKKSNLIETVKNSYHEYVSVKDGAKLYVKEDGLYKEVSSMYGGIEYQLDNDYQVVDKYFKIKDSDFYLLYSDVIEIESLTVLNNEYKYYKNYVVYNENVVLNDSAKLYLNTDAYYLVTGGSYPIIVKDDDRVGIEYQNRLVYVLAEDILNTVSVDNTNQEITTEIGVLNYHYVISSSNENGEMDECQSSICITDTMFDKQMKYLSDNGYYAISLRDLELYIDGKIQLPKNSVSITFDDGWYMSRAIVILEKYQMLGTLFLIGSLASPSAYSSPYLEVHSHSWDMHTGNQCPSNVGRGGILCLDENVVLEDLEKSRKSLNDTTYFCYPFYDYNERAISLLKQAGFTMAFAGEKKDSKVRVGQDKFKIPRYVIVNYTTDNEFISYVS